MNPDWISSLDIDTLEGAMDEELLVAFSKGSLETVVSLLPSRLNPNTKFVDPPAFWEKVSYQFKLLICTDDASYKDVRKQLQAAMTSAKRPSTQIVTALIAGAIGTHLGYVWGPLVGMIGVLHLILVKVGKEAFCQGFGRLGES